MIFDEGSLSTFDLPPDIYRYGARKGDAVAFDFNSNGTTDHWAFIAVAEYNTTTRVDAHNTDHCHAVWNLFGYINHKKYPDPHCTVIHFSD
jgi:hypothetical protein